MLVPWKKSYDKPRQHVKKQRHHFADKGPYSQSYCFSSSDVWVWELDYKKGWGPKNWCIWTTVLERTLKRPLDSKEIKPVNPKGNQPSIYIGELMLKLKLQSLGHAKSQSLEKTLMPGKIEGRRRREQQRMKWLDGITDLMVMSLADSRR